MKVTSHAVLTAEECLQVVDRIYALRSRWTRNRGEFYTLGISAYIEAKEHGAARYSMAAKRQNPLLEEHFGALYGAVLKTLADGLGEPIEYHHRLALPGFHIFLADPVFAEPICSIHVDLPHTQLSWMPYEAVDATRTLSFTLALKLPRAGAGLHVWPHVEYDPAPTAPTPEVQVRGAAPELHRYALGRMVVHDGHSIHQIAPFHVSDADEARITLQGHAIYSSRGWLAYF